MIELEIDKESPAMQSPSEVAARQGGVGLRAGFLRVQRCSSRGSAGHANKESDVMVKQVMSVLVVGLLAMGIGGCADEAEQTVEPTAAQQQQVGTAAANVWVSVTESCEDFFPFPPHNGVCTSTFPSPQCAPSVTEGAVCSGQAQCFRTLSGGKRFKIFDCTPI